ncbi:hypothetical protein L3Q82_020908 [Scortum barcoo]|uniref:Uncharacterized protein n=1 Tax=Scortum barcoo TaxID=214431 RepID=A0ACB8V969_9TELE|nr:hypothetical protein L3Q82_020908 [Scortum barcoo]
MIECVLTTRGTADVLVVSRQDFPQNLALDIALMALSHSNTDGGYQAIRNVIQKRSSQNGEEHQGPFTSPGLALPGPHPGARPGVGARRRAPGGRVFAHGTRPGSARNGDVGPPSSRLTTRRKVHEGPVQCGLGSSRGGGPRRPNPWTKTLAIGTWNVTSLGGKEPELVREVESSPAQPPCVGVHSGEREGRFPAPSGLGLGIGLLLLLFVPYGPNSSTEYRPSWSPWEGYLIVLRLGTPFVLLGDFNAHVGNNSDTWRA